MNERVKALAGVAMVQVSVAAVRLSDYPL